MRSATSPAKTVVVSAYRSSRGPFPRRGPGKATAFEKCSRIWPLAALDKWEQMYIIRANAKRAPPPGLSSQTHQGVAARFVSRIRRRPAWRLRRLHPPPQAAAPRRTTRTPDQLAASGPENAPTPPRRRRTRNSSPTPPPAPSPRPGWIASWFGRNRSGPPHPAPGGSRLRRRPLHRGGVFLPSPRKSATCSTPGSRTAIPSCCLWCWPSWSGTSLNICRPNWAWMPRRCLPPCATVWALRSARTPRPPSRRTSRMPRPLPPIQWGTRCRCRRRNPSRPHCRIAPHALPSLARARCRPGARCRNRTRAATGVPSRRPLPSPPSLASRSATPRVAAAPVLRRPCRPVLDGRAPNSARRGLRGHARGHRMAVPPCRFVPRQQPAHNAAVSWSRSNLSVARKRAVRGIAPLPARLARWFPDGADPTNAGAERKAAARLLRRPIAPGQHGRSSPFRPTI